MTDLSKIKLRPATAEDAEFGFETLRQALGDYIESTWGWDEDFQRQQFSRRWASGLQKIITLGEQDIGALSVDRRPDCIKFNSIYIRPEFQNQGIGTHLVQELIREAAAAQKPIRLRVLKVNPVISLYLRLGFCTTSETENHFVMEYVTVE
ncbi:MAG: GNAT family N-acetyltransferase [candidate division Zixibacteria bacterium]|nr:GNAT family N-acetyltransferase [candidate division Zixibacteria bacterium]MDH3936380.1 GNAT family N-acetyltransferase [candidate division Zixibacteria bacterium]MDH4032211.1 GNAT family N-acetyltransferase [candidate division Zixibacteria bacterium]